MVDETTNDARTPDRSEGDVNLSHRRAAWQKRRLDEPTQRLLAEDERLFLHQSLSTPCLNGIERAEGIHLVDLAGREYMDFHGNNVHQVGFAHPRVVAAVRSQLEQLAFCTRRYTNHRAVELAGRLADLAPGSLNKVLFAPSGTAAIGIALKLARIATGRFKTISMWDSFHGASLDAVSLSGEELFRGEAGPLLPGASHVPPFGEYRCQWDCEARGGCDLKCADYLEYVLEHEGDVAAVVAEPIRCTPFIPAPDYWPRVREACDRHGALLIFDEIPTCLGRTGKMFACEHFAAEPDILVLGKGLGGAVMPLAAVVADSRLDVAGHRALGHYTHEKSPLACAAALATLDVIEEEDLVRKAEQLGAHTLARLSELATRHPLIGDVRGVGLLLGIELVTDREAKTPATDQAEQLMYAALDRGLSFKLTMGSIVTLTPPLTITQAELDQAIDILDASLAEIAS